MEFRLRLGCEFPLAKWSLIKAREEKFPHRTRYKRKYCDVGDLEDETRPRFHYRHHMCFITRRGPANPSFRQPQHGARNVNIFDLIRENIRRRYATNFVVQPTWQMTFSTSSIAWEPVKSKLDYLIKIQFFRCRSSIDTARYRVTVEAQSWNRVTTTRLLV